jgi:hypothetical protein
MWNNSSTHSCTYTYLWKTAICCLWTFVSVKSPIFSADGFSTFPSILAYFPNLSIHNFPRHWDVVQSLSDQSPSVIVNADTGEKVPHWAELDDNLLFIENRTLMIWPAVPLEDSVHYVIGLRSLVDTLGGVIPPSDAFKCLRWLLIVEPQMDIMITWNQRLTRERNCGTVHNDVPL